MGIGDWGLVIGDWGVGSGANPQSPIPNPQSPIPNPQSPIPIKLNLKINNEIKILFYINLNLKKIIYFILI